MRPQPKSNGPFTILLVEDNPAHARLIMYGLQDFEISTDVVHVDDGQAALDYMFQRGRYADTAHLARPHMILLDLHLPRVDGLDVLKEIKASEELRDIPVIILTTSNAEKDAKKAYQQFANSFLVKPNDFDKFKDLLEYLGDYWLGYNYPPASILAA